MMKAFSLIDFYKECQKSLQEIMCSKQTQFLGYDHDTHTLTKLDSEENTLISSINPIGLIELCLEKRQKVEVQEPSKHPTYNPKIDLLSNLSLITVPVIDNETQIILGVFQVINNLKGSNQKIYGKSDLIDKEVMDFVCNIIEICLKRLKKEK